VPCGGGLSSGARLRLILDNRASVVLCTPTYALHLARFAREQGIRLDASTPGYSVRSLIVAGEPGGSIPATRARIEEAWNARVFDHSGMTEIGPLAIECSANPGGLHILEDDYFAEVLDTKTGNVAAAGQPGELVLTNLGRLGSPLLRYRTGDLVRVDPRPCPCGRKWLRLDGGILGRTDDMIAIRGNNFLSFRPGERAAPVCLRLWSTGLRSIARPLSPSCVSRLSRCPAASATWHRELRTRSAMS